MGVTMNFGWGWDHISVHIEQAALGRIVCAEELVRSVMTKTRSLYHSHVGDDATMAGILARHANRLMVFTGPPTDKAKDVECVKRLLGFEGKKAVCGGTTGNIVAEHLGRVVETDMSTLREELPPIGILPEVDLLTEGILTLAKTLQLLKQCKGQDELLSEDRNGAVLLTRELLQADSIFFMAGEKVNAFYQNPLLPKSVSIRRSVLDQIVEELVNIHKEVKVEWL